MAWEAAACSPLLPPTSGIAALLSSIGPEAIIVWAALFTGRRVAVLQSSAAEGNASSRADLNRAVRLLPWLMAHRIPFALAIDAQPEPEGETPKNASASTGGGHYGSGVSITPLVTLGGEDGEGSLRLLLQKRPASGSSSSSSTPVDDAYTRGLVDRGVLLQAAELAPIPPPPTAAFLTAAAAATAAAAGEEASPSYLQSSSALLLPPVCSVSGYRDPGIAHLSGGSHWDVCVLLAGGAGGGGVAVAENRPDLR